MPRRPGSRKNAVIFGLCLLAALLFWVITNLSGKYEVTTEGMIEVVEPDGTVLHRQEAEILANTTGWQAILNDVGWDKTIIRIEAGGNIINTNKTEILSLHSSENFKIIAISPDTINLNKINR